jgi:hypothetical protein
VDLQMMEAVRANLFHAAHSAIDDWDTFPWHSHKGIIQAYKVESSQALALDVFGTIKVSNDGQAVLRMLARQCGLPDEGSWTMKLEWTDPKKVMGETRPTQFDAIAFGERATLIIECKFTEPGGGCSQYDLIKEGRNAGKRQCDGNYAEQVNPENDLKARCALTAKGIKYWDFIPAAFDFDRDKDFRPCPFKGDAYQWMRNVVYANALSSSGRPAAVVAAYADGDFDTARKVRSGAFERAAAPGANRVTPISYQSIATRASALSNDPTVWNELSVWIDRKIEAASNSKQGLD